MTASQNKYDLFRVDVGDTERDAPEIIEHIRQNSTLSIVNIAPGRSDGHPGRIRLELFLQTGTADAEAVRQDLDSYAGCMYQTESVELG